MHRALYVEDILLEIFGYRYDGKQSTMHINKTDLPSLARTCKAFKDPALDILWAELYSLAPLIRCLPGASSQVVDHETVYSLNRPLEQADWDVILNFTRRVRICDLRYLFGVVSECVEELCRPPTSTKSIFPNLCNASITYPTENRFQLLRHFPGPRLVVVKLDCVGDAIEFFREGCLNITSLDFTSIELDNDTISSLICQWSNLRSVNCSRVHLTIGALTHLSNIPHLRYLSVKLCNALVDRIQSTWPSPSKLTFPTLTQCHPRSQSLALVSRFFDHLHLPVVEEVDVELSSRPTSQEFKSLLATLPETCNHQSLVHVHIHVFEWTAPSMPVPDPQYINFHHLYPLTVFVNMRVIHIRLPRGVDLSEQELLQLAPSWPRLEVFSVGRHDDEVRALSAITPGGFVRLLGQWKSLSRFNFPFDTHGYTEIHQGHPWDGLKMRDGAVIDVGVSRIEEDSVEALSIFFHVAPFPDFSLDDEWDDLEGQFEEDSELVQQFSDRWSRVHSLAYKRWMERDNLLSSLRSQGRHCG